MRPLPLPPPPHLSSLMRLNPQFAFSCKTKHTREREGGGRDLVWRNGREQLWNRVCGGGLFAAWVCSWLLGDDGGEEGGGGASVTAAETECIFFHPRRRRVCVRGGGGGCLWVCVKFSFTVSPHQLIRLTTARETNLQCHTAVCTHTHTHTSLPVAAQDEQTSPKYKVEVLCTFSSR